MSVFSKIKKWFKDNFGGGSSKSSRSSSSKSSRRETPTSYYRSGGSSGSGSSVYYETKAERQARLAKEQKAKRDTTTSTLASISKRTDALASGRSSSVASSATHANAGNGTARVLAKIGEKAKATPPTPKDPKEKRRLEAREKREKQTETFNKITNNTYNVQKNGKAARQAQKSQAYDPNVEKYNIKYHPKAESFGRGAASGASFGTSEVLARVSDNRKDTGMEKYYQKNKSKGAELAGEVAGSLIGFGATEKAATKLAGKVAPKALKEGGEYAVRRLAKSTALRTAAKKEAERTGIKATEEVIERFAQQRARRLVESVGSDMAINWTTGGLMDVNQTIRDTLDENNGKLNAKDLAKNFAVNRAMNYGLGGLTTVAPALRTSKGLINIRARDDALDLARRIGAENALGRRSRGLKAGAIDPLSAPRIGESIDRTIARRSAQTAEQNAMERQLPAMRRAMGDAFTGNADNARRVDMGEILRANEAARQAKIDADVDSSVDELIESARTVEDFMSLGLDRPLAEILAEDRAKAIAKGVIPAVNETTRRGIPKGNIEEVSEATAKAAQPSEAVADAASTAVRQEPPRVEPPAAADDFPIEGTPEANDMMRRINESRNRNAETYIDERQALEGRVRELENEPPRFDEEKPLRVNNVAEDTPLGGTTEGVRMAQSAYERNTGENIDEGIKTSWHEAWKASQEYHASHATGRDTRLSKTSVSQLNAMDSDAERELRDKLVDEGWLSYNVIHTDEMLDKVSKQFRDDPKRWVDDMIDINNGRKLDFRETPEWQARVHYIMAVVDPSADPASEIAYTEAFKLATQMSSKAGQTNNLRRQFVHLTPAGRRDAIMDEMAQILYNSQGFVDAHGDMPRDKYDALAYIKEFLEDDPEIEKRVKKLVEVGGLRRDAEYGMDFAAENAAKAADGKSLDDMAAVSDELPLGDTPKATTKGKSDADEIMEAHADLMLALNEKNPKTKFDVVQEIRYLNMLGNPKTHIRNVFGSGFFSPIRQISNAIRSGIERSSLVKNSGMDVTLHGGLSLKAFTEARTKNPTTEAGKKALDAFERLKPELLGSMKLDNQMYTGRAKHLSGKVLDKISDFNSNLLSKEDDIFKQRAFRENYIKSYEAYAKRGTPITKKIERKIEAEAMQEAQIATFNEYNEFAKFLSNITRKAGDPNASTLAKAGGIGVNAVMPFTKVPANIMKQSFNYSPFGIAKGFADIKTAIKRGDSEMMNRAIDELASGTTGTGIFLLGLLLGNTTDSFTTNAGKDDAAAKFKKAQGMQNYSVTFTSPLDGKKYSMTLDWLVPNSATFFAGVEMANQMKAGDLDLLSLGGDVAQISSRVIEPVMETSMLSGLYSMLESTRNGYGDDDKQSAVSIMLRETAQSYVNSLIPTILGQGARTFYKNDKQITGETDWEYFRNQTKSKLGLAETNILGDELGADTTAYGDVKGQKETGGDYAKSALKNFLSPANIQRVDLDEVDEAKIKQYEDAVKNGADPQDMAYLFPKKQYKKNFSEGEVEVQMSNKDLSTYNQAKTTGGSEGMRYILENIMFNRYVKDDTGHKISTDDALTTSQKLKLMKQFEGKSLREVEAWLREQPQFKSASEAEQKKAIDGLWSYSKQGKAQGAKRVGEQAVVIAQGGDVNEYNFNNEITEKKREALKPYIESGVITYEQAVDFARFAGKTYYYEDDEGGHSQTYYNKGVMMDYLKSKGYDDKTAAALFNAFKAWNAKEYGSSSYRRRYGRRGWHRWHRRGHSKKATVPTPKTIKAKDLVQGQALVSKKKNGTNSTNTNPTLKRVEAKIDLPTPKKR